MLNVLHVISGIDAENGGPTRALQALSAAQAAIGDRVRVVTTFRRPTGPANVPSFEQAGVPVTLIGPAWGPSSWHPAIGRTLRPLIEAADVVHIHSMFEEIQHQAARICRKARRPYVLCPHGGLDPWALSQSRLKKRIYLAMRLRRNLNEAAAIHYTTRAEREGAALLGLRAPSLVIPNAIDLSEFDPLPPRGIFRRQHPQIGDRRIVLCLGRIDYKKGLNLLIPAFAGVADPNTVLVLAGPDNDGYGAALQELARQHGVADRLLFTGMLYDRQRIEALVDADLFVMPSYVENFGISAIEAVAAGTRAMISDGVNVAESLRYIEGVDIVAATVDSVTVGLQRCLSAPPLTPEQVKSLRAAAYQFAGPAVAQRWREEFERLTARTPDPKKCEMKS